MFRFIQKPTDKHQNIHFLMWLPPKTPQICWCIHTLTSSWFVQRSWEYLSLITKFHQPTHIRLPAHDRWTWHSVFQNNLLYLNFKKMIISAETCPTRWPASIGQGRWHTQKATPRDHDLRPVCQSGSSFNWAQMKWQNQIQANHFTGSKPSTN